ncbi:MFS transporter [Paraburkholderia lycopersici]|uniref:Predicted arabinose efflux permease, MFS family n=1 Tax=Paraburkholderia lycopersici TaxID=416944 RepID=A0A1G6X7E9_9BURK|nr:MFS transporter [Paraburkholderia lycopersici]SDD74014.1 Predicted arabinose efflux permease, MFS family [Paraburkholderia lycopersici]
MKLAKTQELPQSSSWWTPAWIARLDPRGKKAFAASFGGWAIDAFDFMIFSFVISALARGLAIDRGKIGLVGTATLLASAVGGWIAGMLADRFGRVRMLQATILWFSMCTILIGFVQNFEQLLALRILQGLGFGGEWAIGAVLIAETVRSEDRGKAVGFVQSGWSLGWGAAAIAYSVAFSLLPEQLAWRSLFWAGVFPALIVLFVRRNVEEPDIFLHARAKQRMSGEKSNLLAIFSPPLAMTTLKASALCTALTGGYYAMSTWLPTFLKVERHLSVLNTGGYLMVLIVGSFCGFIAGAYLADLWGRRRTFIAFSLAAAVCLYVYLKLPLTDAQMLVLGFPLGVTSCGVFSGMGAYLSELYPSHVRASGQSFCYNFGRGIGALFPALVGFLSESSSLGSAIAIFAGFAYAISVVMAVMLPETKGRPLQ